MKTETDQKQIKYKVKQIDCTDKWYYASQISNNEQYLAYGGSDILKIHDIKAHKIVKEILKVDSIIQCQFTFDSSQLYIVCSGGQVFGYNVKKNFKEIFRSSIIHRKVLKIRIINNRYLISSNNDCFLRQTDIKRGKQIFKLIGLRSFISQFDYNQQMEDKILHLSDGQFRSESHSELNGQSHGQSHGQSNGQSHDQSQGGQSEIDSDYQYGTSLLLWDWKKRKTLIELEQLNQSAIIQIQLVHYDQSVLILDSDYDLYKRKIDLVNKQLIIIQKFKDPSKIFQFYQVNLSLIVLICGKYFKIVNNQGQTIYKEYHQAGKFDFDYESAQIDNILYIQIRSAKKIMLAFLQN